MRHKKAQIREIKPDKIYQSKLVTKFINCTMKNGKKTVAENNFYSALNIIGQKESNPVSVFERAVQNVGPKTEVKARRVGGANYQIPIEVRGERKTSVAIRWIIEAAKKRSSKDYHKFEQKLAVELIDASNNLGEAIKKRDTTHRMAEANKAFAHFRW